MEMHNGPRSMPPGRTSSISDRFNEKFCQLFWVSHFFVSGLAHSWSMAVLFNYTVRSVMICHSLNLGVLFSQQRVKARKEKESGINPLKGKRMGCNTSWYFAWQLFAWKMGEVKVRSSGYENFFKIHDLQ